MAIGDVASDIVWTNGRQVDNVGDPLRAVTASKVP